jgi:copper chaperone CopZ
MHYRSSLTNQSDVAIGIHEGGYMEYIDKVKLTVDDMSCAHCEKRIQKSLEALPGISNLAIHLEQRIVEFDLNASETPYSTVFSTLEQIGYPAKKNS